MSVYLYLKTASGALPSTRMMAVRLYRYWNHNENDVHLAVIGAADYCTTQSFK